MNVDRLKQLSAVLRGRDFPAKTFFNMCYSHSEFSQGDLKPDDEGDLYDKRMETKMHANGKQVPSEWCGTVVCLAGLTVLLFRPDYWDKGIHAPLFVAAQFLLDLSDDQAMELFTPENGPDWEKISPEQAADVLDDFIENGYYPDWELIET